MPPDEVKRALTSDARPGPGRERPRLVFYERPWISWSITGIAVAGTVAFFAFAPQTARQKRAHARSELKQVASRYLQARERGDAASACRQLSAGAWHDVLGESKTGRAGHATIADCRRVILDSVQGSPYRTPLLSEYHSQGWRMSVRVDGAAAAIWPGGGGPRLMFTRTGGTWKLDELAYTEQFFLRHRCSPGNTADACRCMLASLREHGFDTELKLLGVTRMATPEFRSAASTCRGHV